MKQIEVVFCGNSVYLSGLAASLRQNGWLRVSQVDALLGEAMRDLKLLCPDMVVVEVAERGAVKALLRDNPCLGIIVIKAATDSLAVVSGPRRSTSTVTELARVIMEYAGGQYVQDRDNGCISREEFDER